MQREWRLVAAALAANVITASGGTSRCPAGSVQSREFDEVEFLQLRGERDAVWGSPGSFIVRNDTFLKDGVPVIVRSGSIHYPRIPREYWRDRFQRVKALGLNTITAYIFWNFHEEQEGMFDFSGQKDVVEFVKQAGQEGLMVLLRPGPYICGEWDQGGLPWWLLTKPGMKLRTWNDPYIAAVDKFWGELLPKFKPLLYSQGGPIVMVQIENEYGSYGNCQENPDDARYMYHLLDLAVAALGEDVVYTTIDGGEGMEPAKLEAGSPWYRNRTVVATVDGGLSKDYSHGFVNQQAFNAPGNSPKMWSELWVGWFTPWGSPAANKSAEEFSEGMLAIVRENASFSLYMAHGGTNYATWSGANQNSAEGPSGTTYSGFQPDITSYDYSCPISEQGRQNIGRHGGNLFAAVRDAIAVAYGPPKASFPPPKAVSAYGAIELPDVATLFGNLEDLQSCDESVPEGAQELPTMEALGLGKGLVLYRNIVGTNGETMIVDKANVKDRLQAFVAHSEVGQVYRMDLGDSLNISLPAGKPVDLLVENKGHINYGTNIKEQKGLMGQPPLSGAYTAYCLPLEYSQVSALPFQPRQGQSKGLGAEPLFMRGTLQIDGPPQDTYLDSRGLDKGYIWVNGHNLGRYWETVGPQHTLYLPAPFLQQGANEVIVLDLHGAGTNITSVEWPRWEPVTRKG